MRVLIVLAVILFSASAHATVDKAKACAAVHDVIRIAVDQILGGNQTNRVLVALSAAERLDCEITGVLGALRINAIAPVDRQESSVTPKRDSDRQ